MNFNIKYFTLTIAFLFILLTSYGQTVSPSWETVFNKAEIQFAKGKFKKVSKKLKKLRKKELSKKYSNDSTLLGLALIMEAKADEAMAEYGSMEYKLNQASEFLEQYGASNTYAYIMGYLRMVDLYNHYGNHRKADSLIRLIENANIDLDQNRLLAIEIDIRKALTLIENGFYSAAEVEIQTILDQWPSIETLSYSNIVASKQDKAYTNELYVLLMAAEIRLNAYRGEFNKANLLYEQYKKTVNRLLPRTSPAYTHFQMANALNFYEWKDYKEGRKVTSKILGGSVPPHLVEEVMDLDIVMNLKAGKLGDADVTIHKQEKVFSKLKMNRSYASYKIELNELLYYSSTNTLEDNLMTDFLKLSGKNVPLDHSSKTKLYRLGIDYASKAGISNNYKVAEKFFIELENSLEKRYPIRSIHVAINKVAMAGYYLNYSETPNLAFKYLQGKPYEFPLSELTVAHATYKQIVDDLSEYFILSGDYEYPMKQKEKVVEGLRKNENTTSSELGNDLVELAKLQTLAGYYQKAESNAEEGLKLIRRGGDKKSKEYVKSLNTTAFLYGTIGLYDKAEKLLNNSMSILKKLDVNTKELKMNSVEDLAFLYTRLGNYSETEELLEEVISDKIELYTQKSHRLIKPYLALVDLYLIKGEYPDAEVYISKALRQIETTYGDSTLLYANALEKQVRLDIKLGVYRDALKNAGKILALTTNKLRDDHIKISEVYQLLGSIYLFSGLDDALAESYFTQARDIISSNFNQSHPLYAEAIKNIAYVKIKKGELDEALDLLNQADDIWAGAVGNKNRSSGEVARLKGDIYSFQGEFKNARKEYDKSARYLKQIFSDLHPEYLNTRSRLARANYIEGNLNTVEDILTETTEAYLNYTKTYFPTLSEEEKAKFWSKINPDFEFYNTVAVDFKDNKPKYLENMYDFALATKGLLLNSSIKTRNSILNSGDPALVALFEQWLYNKEYLTSISSQSETEIAENEVDADKLRQETEDIERLLSEKSEAFSESFKYKFYTWNDVRKSLEENEAAVEIIRYREFDEKFNEDKIRYAALIVTTETRRNPQLVLLENGTHLEGKNFNLQRNGVKFKVSETKSFENFWKPIYDEVKDKSIVYISPDGIYNQINIESLYMGDGKYVIDEMNVRVMNSTKSLAINRSKGAKKAEKKLSDEPGQLTALLVGNPDYYQTDQSKQQAINEQTRSGGSAYIAQLPGTEAEIETISDLLEANSWNIDYFLGKDADETSIKNSQNKTLIHIATHGFFDEKSKQSEMKFSILDEDNPMDRSGLLARGAGDVLLKTSKNYNIEDGILTATEAMNMNFDNTELVVLSACETGRGEIKQGEGVFGLQRSFLVAGADAIIMSLFKVSDAVTQNLMIEFYKNWLNGDEKRVAFNKAQKTIKEIYPDPIYWGAFTMVAKK